MVQSLDHVQPLLSSQRATVVAQSICTSLPASVRRWIFVCVIVPAVASALPVVVFLPNLSLIHLVVRLLPLQQSVLHAQRRHMLEEWVKNCLFFGNRLKWSATHTHSHTHCKIPYAVCIGKM